MKVWALLIASFILYVPANVLPIMQSSSLFESQRDTIMTGIVYLWRNGSWPLAVIVFIASILVPIGKLFFLTGLAISVQRRWTWRPGLRARIYRLVEFVGRWSMLDIYVVTLLGALVQIKGLATIVVGPAAMAFAAVVILTIAAARSFDPRLIWDSMDVRDD